MQLGLGVLGLTEAEFWRSTFPGFDARLAGFREFHGLKDQTTPMSRAELTEMMVEFPDGVTPKRQRRKAKRVRAQRRREIENRERRRG